MLKKTLDLTYSYLLNRKLLLRYVQTKICSRVTAKSWCLGVAECLPLPRILKYLACNKTSRTGTRQNVIPIPQMRKLRHREVMWLSQGRSDSMVEPRIEPRPLTRRIYFLPQQRQTNLGCLANLPDSEGLRWNGIRCLKHVGLACVQPAAPWQKPPLQVAAYLIWPVHPVVRARGLSLFHALTSVELVSQDGEERSPDEVQAGLLMCVCFGIIKIFADLCRPRHW